MRTIDISHITYENSNVPKALDGYKILHLTDIHNRRFGEEQIGIRNLYEQISPDATFITGDLIDNYRAKNDNALRCVRIARDYGEVYYVSGNHEAHRGGYAKLRNQLVEIGVHVLDDTSTDLTVDGDTISISGVKDPDFTSDEYYEKMVGVLDRRTDARLKVLLSHKPRLHVFQPTSFDLVFCGHAHGGLMRLPFGLSLYAPEQGFFPKHVCGLYCENETSMVVSRGLGNTGHFPIRLFNPPEVVLVTLRSK